MSDVRRVRVQAYQEPDTGIPCAQRRRDHRDRAGDAAALRLRPAIAADAADHEAAVGTSAQESIVNRVNGRDDVGRGDRAELTFCIDSRSRQPLARWYGDELPRPARGESAAGTGLNFVHASAQDGNCNRRNKNVVFNVRQVTTNQYLARAFFPSTSRSGREILVASSSFGNINPWTLTGVLRHELGHTIGLRHEHTRPESGTCFEDNNWRALTAYDSSSVMHYPQCNGSQNGDLVLTTLDKTGAAALY
jgi:hypothetical protein